MHEITEGLRPHKMRGGRRSREKGSRAERAIVRYLEQQGITAERVPLSGAAGGSYRGDVIISVADRRLCAEVKVRASGFGHLYSWLEDRDILIIRRDRAEPLVILPLTLASEISVIANAGRK